MSGRVYTSANPFCDCFLSLTARHPTQQVGTRESAEWFFCVYPRFYHIDVVWKLWWMWKIFHLHYGQKATFGKWDTWVFFYHCYLQLVNEICSESIQSVGHKGNGHLWWSFPKEYPRNVNGELKLDDYHRNNNKIWIIIISKCQIYASEAEIQCIMRAASW